MKGFILLILSFLIMYIFTPFAMIYTFLKLLLTDYTKINDWFIRLAVSIDQFGNVSAKELLNDVLIKKKVYNKFGSEDETISSVIGKNKQYNTLSNTGKILDKLLSFLDNNHSIKSIEKD